MLILPEGTTSFTIQRDIDKSPVVWTLQEDGTWSGITEDGMTAFGNWKLQGMQVATASRAGENTVDLSEWITRTENGFLVDKNVLEIAKVTNSSAWLFHTPEGLFENPVRIETKK